MANVLFDALFSRHANRLSVFIADEIDGRPVTHGAFIEQTAKLANVLQQHGLKPGDRLVAQVGKSINALALYGACVRSGVVYLPLNTAYTPTEVDYFVGDCGATLMVCDPKNVDELSPITEKHQCSLITLSADGKSGSLSDLAKLSLIHI